MTYDVQRWRIVIGMLTGDFREMRPDDDGPYVLAADAEAHERTAVQVWKDLAARQGDAYNEGKAWGLAEGREQAIRECIAVIEKRVMTEMDTMQDFIRAEPVLAALRSMLEADKP